ncbi:hypothetical protein YM304_24370 [Ilumatobacter coccineus YM16-304]|uniref:Uncharacterized protein n=1 Tax=Ilumatobacter coccineus (strain NBRC 103263 / KCTC 29153 / YM16-304) TaxID=1313172 RepID=A0A6C7E8G0_ILUCY|nr:hypothetical protein YM304_24370 [Ilumatobacter coccineus YM16-304]
MAGGPTERSSLHATTGRIAAVGTALLLVLFLVLSVSRAAFTASTSNDNNSASSAAGITLTDNDAGFALFTTAVDPLNPLASGNAADLTPATPVEQCIRVQYDGDFTSGDVMMYVTGIDAADTLADYLNVRVDRLATPGDPVAFTETPGNQLHDCAYMNAQDPPEALPNANNDNIYNGTLADFPATHADNLSSMPGSDGVYTFRITIAVQDDPEAAAKDATWNFVWETQS